MTDEERIAKLERQLAAKSGGGFVAGFNGCFGVLAAIVVALAGVLALGRCGADQQAERIGSGSASADAYLSHCAAGGVSAKYQRGRPGLEYRIGEDPVVMEAGPPALVACPFIDARGRTVTVTIAVSCPDALDRACVSVRDILG